jgi:zinc transport system substrate-binding protein
MEVDMRWIFLLLMVGVLGCGPKATTSTESRKPVVYVTNEPLRCFAERLAGGDFEIVFPVPKDEDPEDWKPEAALIQKMQQADLILLNGGGYEKWLKKASLPLATQVDTSSAFKEKILQNDAAVTHSHGGKEHAHSGPVGQTWLDLQLAIQQAKAVEAALVRLKPEAAEAIRERSKKLEAELLALDTEMEAVTKLATQKPIIASHPVYGYWARRYNVNLKSLHWEPDDVPTEAQLAELNKLLATHPAKVLVWEDEPNLQAAELVKALGLTSIVVRQCGNTPDKGDFLTLMKKNISALQAALK